MHWSNSQSVRSRLGHKCVSSSYSFWGGGGGGGGGRILPQHPCARLISGGMLARSKSTISSIPWGSLTASDIMVEVHKGGFETGNSIMVEWVL